MMDLGELIEAFRPAKARNKSEFVAYGLDALDVPALAQGYREIQSLAPRRHERGLPYLFERSGRSTTGKSSNRNEEHLAMALYRAFQKPNPMPLAGGPEIELLDYQVPLKARQGDGSVGKVDLLGLAGGTRLSVLELKWVGGDAPLFAVLEALVYSAILKANLPAIARELTAKGYDAPRPDGVGVVVLGKRDYWQEFDDHDPDWLAKLAPRLGELTRELSVPLQLVGLDLGLPEAPASSDIASDRFSATTLFCA